MVWDVTFIVKFLSLFLYAASFPQKMLILKYNRKKGSVCTCLCVVWVNYFNSVSAGCVITYRSMTNFINVSILLIWNYWNYALPQLNSGSKNVLLDFRF